MRPPNGCQVEVSDMSDAEWFIKNLNNETPPGLTTPISVSLGGGNKGGFKAGKGSSPYGAGAGGGAWNFGESSAQSAVGWGNQNSNGGGKGWGNQNSGDSGKGGGWGNQNAAGWGNQNSAGWGSWGSQNSGNWDNQKGNAGKGKGSETVTQ